MGKKGEPRDPLIDHPAVVLHRDIIHLRANYIQRALIADTVDNSERGLRIWRATLIEWMAIGANPKNVLGMLKNYNAAVDSFLMGRR